MSSSETQRTTTTLCSSPSECQRTTITLYSSPSESQRTTITLYSSPSESQRMTITFCSSASEPDGAATTFQTASGKYEGTSAVRECPPCPPQGLALSRTPSARGSSDRRVGRVRSTTCKRLENQYVGSPHFGGVLVSTDCSRHRRHAEEVWLASLKHLDTQNKR